MNFSNKFKIAWWVIVLIILTIVSIWRLFIGSFTNVDIFIFLFWFILVLFPIISEISIFGISLKKEIEVIKSDIKDQFVEIKNSINNHQNQVVNVHTVTIPADKKEIEQKLKEDIVDEKETLIIKEQNKLSISQNKEEKRISLNERVIERQEKISSVEKLVNQYYKEKYGALYKSQMKIEDVNSKQKIIVDAIVEKPDKKISEIIEIKLIGPNTPEAFYFVASRFIRKLQNLGIQYPIHFVITSEYMNIELAQSVNKEIQKLRFSKNLGIKISWINATFFKFEDNKLEEVII